MSGHSALELAAVVTLGTMLVLFIVDFEIRVSGLQKQLAAGFQKIHVSAALLSLMERSVLDTALLSDLVEAAGKADTSVSPMLERLARQEIERVTRFVRQLPAGNEIAYDGEDREWLLGLTEQAQRSVDAISLSTVDAGMRGFDGGLWTSDLGTRYLNLQREAIERQVAIRRIFIFENEDLARDETFLKITAQQREVGVDVRMLDHQLIPEHLQKEIFDFIVFDGAVGYETTSATPFPSRAARPAIVRTRLAPMPDRVRDLESQFEKLWDAADPERQIER
ncbi:MAG TPA: hypothetical protein VHZ03_17315 [Trebonia sp.]|jgi:hypothetical protein|nr:hypothetical protein [Trebonia sp.]